MTREPIATKRRTVTADERDVLAAWLIVLQRVSDNDKRLVAIWALSDFSGHRCVVCTSCVALYPGGAARHPMTITEVVEHYRRAPSSRHRLALFEPALLVIP